MKVEKLFFKYIIFLWQFLAIFVLYGPMWNFFLNWRTRVNRLCICYIINMSYNEKGHFPKILFVWVWSVQFINKLLWKMCNPHVVREFAGRLSVFLSFSAVIKISPEARDAQCFNNKWGCLSHKVYPKLFSPWTAISVCC